MADLMPTKKIWTSPEGVQIEYITYRTMLVDRVRDSLTRAGVDIDTDEVRGFILCTSVTTNVILPEAPPLWGQVLHDMVKSGHWLKTPSADYESLAYAPSLLLDSWYTGYKATRDQSHAAPAELQQPAPLKPDEEGAAESHGEEGPQDESHPTTSAAPSLSVLSSTGSGRRSRTRTEATS
jgi:hypothetical protein